MFEKYIKESRNLEKKMKAFHETAVASLNKSITSQPIEFQIAIKDILSKAAKGEVTPAQSKEAIEKLRDLQSGDNN